MGRVVRADALNFPLVLGGGGRESGLLFGVVLGTE